MKSSILSLGCAVVMLASCDPRAKTKDQEPPPAANQRSVGAALVNPPPLAPVNGSTRYAGTIDRSRLDDVFRLTRLAFRERDGVLRGGDATAATEISARGITITPYRWPQGATITPDAPIDNTGVVAGAPLHLETARITRGPSTLFARHVGREVRLADDGSAEIDSVSATETVRNIDGGIEQAWRFDQAPEGTGDLTVRVAVAGLAYGTRTAGGLHFRDHATGLGFSYGDGTWIDAEGAQHHVPATYTDGEIVLTVPDHVVRASQFPAVLDPTVGAEKWYDDPILGPAVATQIEPDLAYSGNAGAELLIAWADRRRDTDQLTYTIFAATIDVAAVHAPVTGSVVSDEPGDQQAPAVAWGFRDTPGDGRYFVVWNDVGSGTVRGRSVLATGAPAPGESPQLIGLGIDPDVAFAGFGGGDANRFAVTWTDPAGTTILARRLTLDTNSVPQPVGPLIDVDTGASMGSPAIASGKFGATTVTDGFFIVWHESLDVYGTSMTGDGVVPGPWIGLTPIATVSVDHENPVLAYSQSPLTADPRGFVLVWEASLGLGDIRVRYLNTQGDLAILGSEIAIATGPIAQTSPAVAGSNVTNLSGFPLGPHWLVTWVESGDIRGQRMVTGAGGGVATQGASFLISSTPFGSLQSAPTVSAYLDQNSNYFVAWTDDRNTNWADDIYGARVDNNGNVLDPGGVLITQSANQQDAPAIASCLGRYLTVWSDSRSGFLIPQIYGAITDAAGTVLVDNIAISNASGAQRNPDVSCNRNTGDFFVVWESGGQIAGTRVAAATGALLDPFGILISSGAATKKQPAVAFEGSTYLVVFSDRLFQTSDLLVGQRVNAATGALISGPIAIAYLGTTGRTSWRHENPDVTYDEAFAPALPADRRFFVVWEMTRTTTGIADITGRFVQEDGTIATPLIPVTANSWPETRPSVATRPATSGVDRFHVVALEQTLSGVKRLAAVSVTPSGSIASSVVMSLGVNDLFEPQIANRTPDEMVLTFWFKDSIIWGTDPTFDFGVLGQDLAAGSPTTLGLLNSFQISPFPAIRERSPAVACGTLTECQVPYRRYDDDPSIGVDRVRYRMLTY